MEGLSATFIYKKSLLIPHLLLILRHYFLIVYSAPEQRWTQINALDFVSRQLFLTTTSMKVWVDRGVGRNSSSAPGIVSGEVSIVSLISYIALR